MKNLRVILCLMLLGFLCACGGGTAPKPPYAGIKIGKPYEVYGRRYEPGYNAHYDEIGIASWYGPGFHGGHTANGERFEQDALTAAHKTLPLPSIVRVTNLDNGLSAIVRINDRGPFAHDRIIDLSRGAARRLGVIRTGTAKVRVQFLERETREYVQNMQNGTQYAMRGLNPINPPVNTSQGFLPPSNLSEFSVVDNAEATEQLHNDQHRYAPVGYQTRAPSSVNKGFFVQAGTFSLRDNAFGLIDRISGADAPQVMEVVMNGRKLYRVMVGPYGNRDDAKNMLSKLASIGISNAKIIRN